MSEKYKIREYMNQERFAASKKMGQNFLHNRQIKERIVNSAQLSKNELVIEIGPGLGAISEIIVTHPVKLVAIELDKRLAAHLTNKFSAYQNVKIINQDVLKTNLDEIIQDQNYQSAKLIANLPYSISSLVILKIMHTSRISESIVMVQKEMAERIVAKPKSKAYNAFSALLSLYLKIELLFHVGPKNFIPAPKVDSSVVRISPIKENKLEFNLEEIDLFFKKCFMNKRKTLVNNLMDQYDKEWLIHVLNQLGYKPTVRAQELSASSLLDIYQRIKYES